MFSDKQRLRDIVPPPPRYLTDRVGERLLLVLTQLEEVEKKGIMDYDEKEPVVRDVFLEQFHYHVKWPSYAILLVLIAFVINVRLGSVQLQAYGLVFDMVGGVLLALGIVRGKGGLMRDTREPGARVGGDEVNIHQPALKANIADTIDGLFGAIFLVVGFSIQIVAVLS